MVFHLIVKPRGFSGLIDYAVRFGFAHVDAPRFAPPMMLAAIITMSIWRGDGVIASAA